MSDDRSRSLKKIVINGRSLQSILKDAYAALTDYIATHSPEMFQNNGRLVRIKYLDGGPQIEPLDHDMLRSILDRVANFYREWSSEKGRYEPPPIDPVRDFFCQPSWPENAVPKLEGIVTCPVYSADGALAWTPGYNREARLWYEPDPQSVVKHVPLVPTMDDVERSKLLLNEVFSDFPFKDNASRANAWAFLLTPFVRRMISTPVPLGVVQAPAPGTGKGLLIDCITMIFLGVACSKSPQPESDAEWRKVISASLLELPTFVAFDNLTGVLRSGPLELLLTADFWTDRVLGKSERMTLRNRTIWLATGNNVEIAGDLSRRVIWIDLDANMERPDERPPTQFKHPDVLKFIHDNRGELVRACLVLIQAWFSQGRPAATSLTMGSFQSWAETLGGVLDAIGIQGILANASKKRTTTDDGLADGRRLCREWWNYYGDNVVKTKEIFEIVQAEELYPYVLSAETELGQKQRLGKLLPKLTNRVFDHYRIELVGADNSERKRYRLANLDEPRSNAIDCPDQEPSVEAIPDQQPSNEQLVAWWDGNSSGAAAPVDQDDDVFDEGEWDSFTDDDENEEELLA